MIRKERFGTINSHEVYKYTVSSSDLKFSVMNFGATVTELFVPDKNGVQADVAVGFSTAADYKNYSDNQGATIGRYANRIKNGTFFIDGKKYSCPCNDSANMLHGNNEFRDAFWELTDFGDNFLEFSYTSPDNSNGFPGTLLTKVKFTLCDNSLKINYDAVSDKKTIICLTNHLYFNLTGNSEKTIYSHILKINAQKYTAADPELIPTGEILPVNGTALDFRTPKPIGKDIFLDETVKGPGGYDMNFCIDDWDSSLRKAAELTEPESGRIMEVYTDLPGMQVYSGNWLKEYEGKYNKHFCKHGAVCLETQFYPDTPNHSDFPQCTFKAGEHFKSQTIYKFKTAK